MFRFLLLFCLFSLSAYAEKHKHIPLELSFEESYRWQKFQEKRKPVFYTMQEENQIEINAAIRAGERLYNWINLVNEQRTEENKIRLSDSSSRGNGIPVDSPMKYGPSTIKKDYLEILAEIPEILKTRLFGEDSMEAELPTTDEEFIKWGKKVERNYEIAVRWEGLKPWRNHYAQRKTKDVRGYYHLNKYEDLDSILWDFANLPEAEQAKIKESMIMICINSTHNKRSCAQQIELGIERNKLVYYKNRYWANAEANWNSFFEISNPRTDVVWTAQDPSTMYVTFEDPANNIIKNWLKENIEDEFRRESLGWSLQMNFVSQEFHAAHIHFQSGVTPHVRNGNTIVMNENVDIEEFSVRWTIRHEYGHILRLPDCYLEFYEESENLMINYQLDINDLMCSRKGDMNDRIYNELKRVYYHE